MGNIDSMEIHNRDESLPIMSAHCESEDEPQAPLDPNAKRIIDLNDHCLEKIFELLNFQSLFDVAISNEWLRPAASTVYKLRFDQYHVVVTGNAFITDRRPIFESDKIIIDQLKSILLFLRCFRSSITVLEIDSVFYLKKKQYEYINQYVNKYCAESLVSISFESVPKITKEHFVKPFINVENVKIKGGLEHYLASFADWFPNMRHLTFVPVNMHGERFTDLHFQHVERLSIHPFVGMHNCLDLTNRKLLSLEASKLKMFVVSKCVVERNQKSSVNFIFVFNISFECSERRFSSNTAICQ